MNDDFSVIRITNFNTVKSRPIYSYDDPDAQIGLAVSIVHRDFLYAGDRTGPAANCPTDSSGKPSSSTRLRHCEYRYRKDNYDSGHLHVGAAGQSSAESGGKIQRSREPINFDAVFVFDFSKGFRLLNIMGRLGSQL